MRPSRRFTPTLYSLEPRLPLDGADGSPDDLADARVDGPPQTMDQSPAPDTGDNLLSFTPDPTPQDPTTTTDWQSFADGEQPWVQYTLDTPQDTTNDTAATAGPGAQAAF